MNQLQLEQLADAEKVGSLVDLAVELLADTDPTVSGDLATRIRSINLTGMSMLLGVTWQYEVPNIENFSLGTGAKIIRLGDSKPEPTNGSRFLRQLTIDNDDVPKVWAYDESLMTPQKPTPFSLSSEYKPESLGTNLDYTEAIHGKFLRAMRWAVCLEGIRQT